MSDNAVGPLNITPRDPVVDEAYQALVESHAECDVPLPALDAHILAAANAVVSGHTRPSGWRRWQVPAALAATVLLAVGVVDETRLLERPPKAPEPHAADKIHDTPALSSSVPRAGDTSASPEAQAERKEVAPLAAPAAGVQSLSRMRAADATGAVDPERDALLAELRALRTAGHEKALQEALATFLQRYPDYPLPPDLR